MKIKEIKSILSTIGAFSLGLVEFTEPFRYAGITHLSEYICTSLELAHPIDYEPDRG